MEKIVKVLPIIYAVLIFAGYLDYLTYYRLFHIPIVSYLSSAELLLSFLSITPPLLIIIVFLSIFFVVELSAVSGNFQTANVEKDPNPLPFIFQFRDDSKDIYKMIQRFRFTPIASLRLAVFIFHFCISFIAMIFFFFYFLLLLIFLLESEPLTVSILPVAFFLSVVWFSLLLNIIILAVDKLKKEVSSYVLLCSLIFIYLGLTVIYNKQKASRIINGVEEYKMTLQFDNKIVTTDSTFLFVGKTEKYFFFFDKKRGANVIYRTDQANTLEFQAMKQSP